MKSLTQIWRVLEGIAVIATIVGLVMTIKTVGGLKERVAELENVRKIQSLVTSFSLQKPTPGELKQIPAKQPSVFEGVFAGELPTGYVPWGVLEDGGGYYIARPQLKINELQRRWTQYLRPWPGKWSFHICIAEGSAAVEFSDWAGEKTLDGETDWNNSRSVLPDGAFCPKTFNFVALEE